MKLLLFILLLFSQTAWSQHFNPNWPLGLRPGIVFPVTALNSTQYNLSGYCYPGQGDVQISFGTLNFLVSCHDVLGVYFLDTDVSADVLTNPTRQCITQGPHSQVCSNFTDNQLAPANLTFDTPLDTINFSNVENYLVSGSCAPAGGLISVDVGAQVNILSGSCGLNYKFAIAGDLSSVSSGSGITVSGTLSAGASTATDSVLVDKVPANPPPSIASMSAVNFDLDSDGWLEAGESFNVTVQFLENVHVDPAVEVGLFLSTGLKNATYVSGTGSSTIIFSVSILPGDEQCNGIVGISGFELNGLGIRDFSGQQVDISTMPSSLITLGIDTVPPEFGAVMNFASSDATFTQSPILVGDGYQTNDACGTPFPLEASITDSADVEVQPFNVIPPVDVINQFYRFISGVDGFSFTLVESEPYKINFRSIDQAGNSAVSSSTEWYVSPIVNIPNIIVHLTGQAPVSIYDENSIDALQVEFTGDVNVIEDVSGSTNTHHFTSDGVTQRPLYDTMTKEFSFDGVNDCMKTPNHPELNTATVTQRSYGALFRTGADVVTRQTIYEEGGGARGMNVYISNNVLYCGFWNQTNDGDGLQAFVSQSVAVSPNTIYNVVPVFDYTNYAGPAGPNGAFDCYIDGVSMGASQSITSRLFAHSGNVALGCNGGGTRQHDGTTSAAQNFNGDVMELMIFNSPPDATGVLDIYNYMSLTWGL